MKVNLLTKQLNCVILISHTHGSEKFDIFAGGAEIQVQKLINFFTKYKKIKIHLITHFTKHESKQNLRVTKIGNPKLPFFIAMILYILKTCFLLFKLNKTEKIDIIYSHMIGFACFPTIFARKILKIPSLSKVSGKNTKVREKKSSIYVLDKILRTIILNLRYIFIKNLDYFQVLNTDLKEELSKIYRVKSEKIIKIPNGIEFKYTYSKNRINKIDTFGFVGRLEPVKNLPVLIRAFKKLKNRSSSNIFLSIYGIGAQKPFIEELIRQNQLEDNVFLKGFVSDIDKIYSNIDCFILPSKSEGVNNALLEAISYGIPVIVSDIPSNRELIRHRKSGFLFDYTNANELSEFMEELMKNIELAQKLTKTAYKDIKKKFSMNSIGKMLIHNFLQIINP